MFRQSTICAISTAAGAGGIAVIRVCGEEAFTVVDKIFRSKRKNDSLKNQKPYTVGYGTINDVKTNETIDEVLVTVFHAPHSFTGDNTVEIACHGSIYVQQEILRLLVDNGCHLAQPGEFTMRAFVNGKMDLSQAEAVADLIASTTRASHRMAIKQMRGGFSAELQKLRTQLLDFVSLIELELDFSEEDVEFADRKKLKNLAENIEQHISQLADSFKAGNVLKNGIPIALVGETNVGKSTLLNMFLNEDKAIVSEIHGTTRDTIEDLATIEGLTFRFIDTAGIRNTTDQIEILGIERTYQKIEQAEIVLWLVDSTAINDDVENFVGQISECTAGKKVILVFNKIDKLSDEKLEYIKAIFDSTDMDKIYISAKSRTNTDALQKMLVKTAHYKYPDNNGVVVNNIRHYDALLKAKEAIIRVISGLDNNISGDLLSQDIRECMYHLGEITGQISTDEVLGNIFSKFCIGK